MRQKIGIVIILSLLLLSLLVVQVAGAANDCNCSKAVIKDMVQSPVVYGFSHDRDYKNGYGMPVWRILDPDMEKSFLNCNFHRGPPWCALPPPPPP